jgi:two-component system autoinducer 2 sensor kinase/phosphatase LuxQ
MSDRLALVIEDDFDASVIFAKALEVIGFTTEVIASGDKALKRLKESEPEMIVLDLHLPEVIGNDILKYIRSEERLTHTIVIVASADPRSAETIQDQADLVLIKPTTFSQVRDFAQRLSRGKASKKASPRKSGEEAEKLPVKTQSNEKKEVEPSQDMP